MNAGKRSASGDRFNTYAMTAAHRSLPFGTKVCVRNLGNGRTAIVRINDDGPHVAGRIIDLSRAAADAIGMGDLARVRLTKADSENGCDDGQAARRICRDSLRTAVADDESGKVLSVTVSADCPATKVLPVFANAESAKINGTTIVFGEVEQGSKSKTAKIPLQDEYTSLKVLLQKNETTYVESKEIKLPGVSSTGDSTEDPTALQPVKAPTLITVPPPIVGPPPVEAPPAGGNL